MFARAQRRFDEGARRLHAAQHLNHRFDFRIGEDFAEVLGAHLLRRARERVAVQNARDGKSVAPLKLLVHAGAHASKA